MSNELLPIRQSDNLPAVASNPMELLSIAVQRGNVDVGTIERLAALAEKFEAKRAKQEYDSALAAFQAECPVILKTVAGAQNAYRYAPLDHIVSQTRTLLEKHGFSFSLSSLCGKDTVKAIIKITHRAGHFDVSEFEVPVDSKNPMMTSPQRFGGAMTFAKRYAFCNAFGILTADEDRDAQGPRTKAGLKAKLAAKRDSEPQTQGADIGALKAKLWALLLPVRGPAKSQDWLRSQKILPLNVAVRDMTEADLTEAIDKASIALNP